MHFIQTVLRNLRRSNDPSPNIPRNAIGETAVQEAVRKSKEATTRFNVSALKTIQSARQVLRSH